MIRFMCLSVCIFFTLFLSSCGTVTRSIKDPDIPPSEIRMKYPYKFYISSIHFFYDYREIREIKHKSEIKYSDEQTFITDIRKKLAVLYPQIFVAEPNDSTIPINYEITYGPDKSNDKFLQALIGFPFVVCDLCSFGLFPSYFLSYHDMQVHAQVSLKINASCQREVVSHERTNIGLLGFFFNTRKLFDFSDKDVPMEDGIFNLKITSSGCSEKFLKLFVYALQELDHTQIQLLYNEKYHPKVDFILP